MAINVRDEQVVRETILLRTISVRDEQVLRETICTITTHVVDRQVFRESIVVFAPALPIFSMCFSAT